MKKVKKKQKAQGITLKDVMAHIRGMEERLTCRIDENTRGIAENTRGIAQNTAAIQNLTLRIDALEEDLTAVIEDAFKIRKHVGMATNDE